MKILSINTCGAEGSFALADTAQPGEPRLVTMPGRSASERLVAELRRSLADLGWKVADLEAIAVVTGPGSFTGVRVGLSVAKGLSEASGTPVIAISRLALLASVRRHSQRVCALLDAGRGEFYCGLPEGESLVSLDGAVAAGVGADVVVVCEEIVERALVAKLSVERVAEPTAADALPLALLSFYRGEIAHIAILDANYLRRTDAEIFSSPSRKTAG